MVDEQNAECQADSDVIQHQDTRRWEPDRFVQRGNNNSHNTVLGEAYNGKYIAIQYYTAKHTWHDVYNINSKMSSSAPGFSGQGQIRRLGAEQDDHTNSGG